jgi:adenosylcobyric acid synthase
VLGICGGFQMLARTIIDPVESGSGEVAGLGLLDVDVTFAPEKTLHRPIGSAFGAPATGYEIHHGQLTRRSDGLAGLVTLPDGTPEGALVGPIAATHWHGLLENDEVRRALLRWAAGRAGRAGFRVAPHVVFADVRAAQLDLLADLVAEHLDTDAVWRLLDDGPTGGLPLLPPGATH